MNNNLYNLYRPMKFEHITQPFVTKVLKAQINTDTHPSSYLFYGPPGTGKTTTARVMAMALMCDNLINSEPCGSCLNCEMIKNDRCRDVIEINCAVNGKVEEVRELISERLRIPPTNGKWRIIILDECHMLTTQSQNALLKPIEEPPPYVKFFLCTTDKDKVVPAIQSRCEHHEMSLVNDKDMMGIMTKILKQESVKHETSALQIICEASEGSVRKALVLLSQLITIGVTEDNVSQLLKRAPKQLAIELLKQIMFVNRAELFQLIEAASLEGRDLGSLLNECAKCLMQLTKYKVMKISKEDQDKNLEILMYGGVNHKGENVPGFSPSQIVDVVNNLLEISSKLRQNVPADILVQVNMLKVIDRFAKLREATK
jgi:DNA polymerase-3 subunit gamma/tau